MGVLHRPATIGPRYGQFVPLDATCSIRLTRPSRNLAAAEQFWVAGLGLDVLWRATHEDGSEPDLLMVGWVGASWHLELVADQGVTPCPTEEDLLVIYVDGPVEEDLLARLVEAGGTLVESRNPYWEAWGRTIADPDGYRLVLSNRRWG